MAVEDVQFLLQNSEQDSALIFVDSSMRDREFHPTPASYTVDFDEPIRHVFGIDVLDATIPGTMYNVDINNNSLSVMVADCTLGSAFAQVRSATGSMSTALVEDAQTRVMAEELHGMGFCTDLHRICSVRGVRSSILVIDDDAACAPEVLALLRQPLQPVIPNVGEAEVLYAMVRTRMAGVPMSRLQGTHPTVSIPQGMQATSIPFQGGHYALPRPDLSPDVVRFAESLPVCGYALMPSSITWSHPISAARGAEPGSLLIDVVYYRMARLPGPLFGWVSEQPCVRFQFETVNILLEPGNYTVSTLFLQLQSTLRRAAGIDAQSTSSGTVDKQSRFRFTAPADKRFVLLPEASSARSLLGFDEYAQRAENRVPSATRAYNSLSLGGSRVPVYASVLRDTNTQVLELPGIANLLGVRYITLRCPEIEQHVGTAGKYGRFSTGIGTFKLANSSEVAQLRFDFVSLIRRPFHPIGRLTRLSLRFELADGTLYDFKGMNHQLLVTIKYYRAAPRTGAAAPLVTSVLNPDYNPDFLGYLNTQTRARARAGVDRGYDDEPDLDGDGVHDGPDMRAVAQAYREHDVYDHSSCDDESHTTDCSSEEDYSRATEY
jgi:hypothetical protein